MVLFVSQSFSFYLTKTLWILFIVFHQINLVICDDSEDNLRKALETIERRQRDLELQESEYYGQPENIGYGFQKTFGFFDNNRIPADSLGFDLNSIYPNDLKNVLQSYHYEGNGEKRKSNFRERMVNNRMNYLLNEGAGQNDYQQVDMEHLIMLKNLLSKYHQSRNDDFSLEDLSDEELENILNLYERDNEEEKVDDVYRMNDVVPGRNDKNYVVFEEFRGKPKRYSSFGEGKSYHSPYRVYENPSKIDFSNFLKYMNPETNQEEMENSREIIYDDKDDSKDIIRILSLSRPKFAKGEKMYWPKDQVNYDDGMWLQGPISLTNEWYDTLGRNEKRKEMTPKHFKAHNGIHLNEKKFPVKRSSIRVKKEMQTEKPAKKELKNIFESSMTVPSKNKKKGTEKKAGVSFQKQRQVNATKPTVTKHREDKKVIRSVDKPGLKEQIFPIRQNEEISDLFSEDHKVISKKSIDWSQYFGIDKRGYTKDWLNSDYLSRSDSHFLSPKAKRFSMGDKALEMPFDTRGFYKKNLGGDVRTSIDKVETKIGDIEDKIIDDALKYTGAHSGTNEDGFSEVQKKVLQNLKAAFSLEKMKSALEEFKNLIRSEGERPEPSFFEPPKKSVTEVPNLPHIPPPPPPSVSQTTSSALKEISNSEKLMEKETSGIDEAKVQKTKESDREAVNRGPKNLEFLNVVSYPSGQYGNGECPVVDRFQQNCLQLEETSGKFAELLVPLCSLQQICYFCGREIGFSKLFMCDSMYLMEARNLCQGDGECFLNARNNLLVLKDLSEQNFSSKSNLQSLSGSCLANPCLRRYFSNSPGAIYSLQTQN